MRSFRPVGRRRRRSRSRLSRSHRREGAILRAASRGSSSDLERDSLASRLLDHPEGDEQSSASPPLTNLEDVARELSLRAAHTAPPAWGCAPGPRRAMHRHQPRSNLQASEGARTLRSERILELGRRRESGPAVLEDHVLGGEALLAQRLPELRSVGDDDVGVEDRADGLRSPALPGSARPSSQQAHDCQSRRLDRPVAHPDPGRRIRLTRCLLRHSSAPAASARRGCRASRSSHDPDGQQPALRRAVEASSVAITARRGRFLVR